MQLSPTPNDQMWPEGAQDIAAVNKRPVTAGKSFRTSMKALVEQLELKEPFYVRCVTLRLAHTCSTLEFAPSSTRALPLPSS